MSDLDLAIETIVTDSMLVTGAAPSVVLARGGARGVSVGASVIRSPRWMQEEKKFLRENIGKLSDSEIGSALGRSDDAIKIKRTRWGFVSPSKRTGYLTAHQVCLLLSLDSHNIKSGRLKGIQCPYLGGRDKARWAFWFVRKSEVLSWRVPKGSDVRIKWISDRADEFMLRMSLAGKNAGDISRMMKRDPKTVGYRIRMLKKQRKVT